MTAPGSGFNADTPDDILLDSGVLLLDGDPIGVSRGGLRFNPGIEIRELDYDGRKAPVVGGDRIAFRRPVISGTMLQAGEADFNRYEPGGATPDVTPKPQGVMFVEGDYLTDLALVFKRGNGGTCTITFPFAICKQYEVVGQNQSEAEIAVVFEARIEQGATPDDSVVPYTIELGGATP